MVPGKTKCPRKRLGTGLSEGEARRLFGRQLDLCSPRAGRPGPGPGAPATRASAPGAREI